MGMILTLLEGSSIFAVVCGTVLWIDALAAPGPAFAASLCWSFALYYNDLYDLRTVRSFSEFARRLPRSVAVALLPLAALYALFPRTRLPSVPSFLITAGAVVGLLLVFRALFYRRVVRSRLPVARVLIVGMSPLGRMLVREIEAQPYPRYSIVGVVDDGTAADEFRCGYPLLGPVEHLGKIIAESAPDRIFITLSERRGRLPVRQLLAARVRGIVVEDGVEVYERLTGKLAIESLTPSNLIFSRDFRKSRLHHAFIRGISFFSAGLGLIGLAPVLGLIAGLIKLDSSGPVFFVQNRVGLGGKPFKLVKFRTMHPAGRKTSEWVRDNNDRITRVGKWLRKFRLDELPQFVNILRGDMELVGPRPHPVSNFEMFVLVMRNAPERATEIPYYSLRSVVRPGLTGWAQIRYGYANNLEEEIEKMRYDLYYIKHMSLWLDLRILFGTVKTVLSGHDAIAGDVLPTEAPASGPWALPTKIDQNRVA